MLEVSEMNTYYDKSHILEDVSLRVGEGEIVALLGRNGAGKTTTLRSIAGLTTPRSGSVTFLGEELVGLETYLISRKGVKLVPEHRGVFGLLNVEENLAISERTSPWTRHIIYQLFPRLFERRLNPAQSLSGGEQQMLAIARALLNGPRILLLDEPTEGLAPVIVGEIIATIQRLRDEGVPVLLVEQNISVCEEIADRHYILEEGRVVFSGTRHEFAADRSIRDRHLALSA